MNDAIVPIVVRIKDNAMHRRIDCKKIHAYYTLLKQAFKVICFQLI